MGGQNDEGDRVDDGGRAADVEAKRVVETRHEGAGGKATEHGPTD